MVEVNSGSEDVLAPSWSRTLEGLAFVSGLQRLEEFFELVFLCRLIVSSGKGSGCWTMLDLDFLATPGLIES